MKFFTALVLGAGLLLTGYGLVQYSEAKVSVAAMALGYVQKVDPESGKVLWVRRESRYLSPEQED